MKNKYTAAEDHQICGHSLEIYDLMRKNCRLIILFQNGNCFSITAEKKIGNLFGIKQKPVMLNTSLHHCVY